MIKSVVLLDPGHCIMCPNAFIKFLYPSFYPVYLRKRPLPSWELRFVLVEWLLGFPR
jgi:hypothetical protein